MPPVDAAVLQQTRYDRQRMNVISRAMDKVANVVSCFPSTSNIAVSCGVSTVRVDVDNGEWKKSPIVYDLQWIQPNVHHLLYVVGCRIVCI